jgi:hypothetical protein
MLHVAIAAITVVASLVSAPVNNEGNPLADSIETFNRAAATDEIGKTQNPLTEQEVVAAILMWEPTKDSPVSNALLEQFRSIAKTKELPHNATIEKLTGYDPGGDHVFDVWSVRIRMQRPDDSSYSFVIRERVIAARTIVEELDALKDRISALPEEQRRLPGFYRIHDRVKELEKRIEESNR